MHKELQDPNKNTHRSYISTILSLPVVQLVSLFHFTTFWACSSAHRDRLSRTKQVHHTNMPHQFVQSMTDFVLQQNRTRFGYLTLPSSRLNFRRLNLPAPTEYRGFVSWDARRWSLLELSHEKRRRTEPLKRVNLCCRIKSFMDSTNQRGSPIFSIFGILWKHKQCSLSNTAIHLDMLTQSRDKLGFGPNPAVSWHCWANELKEGDSLPLSCTYIKGWGCL